MYSGAELHFSEGFDDLFLQDDYSKEVFNQPDQFLSEAQISSTPEYLFGNSSNQVDKIVSPKPLVDPCYGVLTQYLEKELEKIPQMKESVSESTNMSPQQGNNTVPLVSYSQMMFGADAQEPSVLVTVMIKKNPQQEVAPESRISSQIYQCIKDLLERQMKIARFKAKKRNFGKRTYYNDRRMMADRRLRVKGRFISKKVAEEYMSKGGDALLIEGATKNIKSSNTKSKSGKGTAQTERENLEASTRTIIQKLQRKSNLFKITHF